MIKLIIQKNKEIIILDTEYSVTILKSSYNKNKGELFKINKTIIEGEYINKKIYYFEILNYFNCKKNGRSEIWEKNSFNNKDFDYKYINNELILENIFLYDICYYKDNHLHGESKQFYENGNINYKTFFKNNEIDGYYYSFREMNVLHKIDFYNNGEKEGLSQFFDENGYLEKEIIYQKKIYKYTIKNNYKHIISGGNYNYEYNGRYEYFYENGDKFKECYYIKNKLNGEYKEWSKDKKIYINCFYIFEICPTKE
jgi:antitoxin component YwqK of YwqJK toxin-antitoxin module